MAGENGGDRGRAWPSPFSEKASREWLARVQSDVAAWSELATKLTTTRSASEAVETYSKCLSQRMQIAAEDGRRLFDEGQQIAKKITQSLTGGWRPGST
jgi:hypothetical protein